MSSHPATQEALKPCPFCGCSGEFDNFDGRRGEFVACANCGARTSAMSSQDGARDVWNMRYLPSARGHTAAERALQYLELFKADEKAKRRLDWGWIALVEQTLKEESAPAVAAPTEEDAVLAERLNNSAEGVKSLGYGTELYKLLKQAAQRVAAMNARTP